MDGGDASCDPSDDEAAVQHHVKRTGVDAVGVLLAPNVVQVFMAEAERDLLHGWKRVAALVVQQ